MFEQGHDARVERIGLEGQPIVIIDHAFGADADALVGHAVVRSKFEPAATVGSGYPGLLGPAPRAYVDALVSLALDAIGRHVGEAVRPIRARGNFSLVTTPADDLLPYQRMPHVDAADPLQFAIVHYLARGNVDGTAFYRHRATGFETVDQARLPAYRAALDAESAIARSGYVGADDAGFERIGMVEARFDRVVLYRASLLHSGAISAVPAGAADPRSGRLTGNLFLACRAA